MNDNNTPKNNEEVDIIALFEYFRKGFWNLFNLFAGILLFFFNLFVKLYFLLRKNLILVAFLIIGCALGGYFYNKYKPKVYYYETIVRANYNSIYELYNFVGSLEKTLKNSESNEVLAKTLNYDLKTIDQILDISIEPIEDFEDVIASYYGKKGIPFTNPVRDSLFYQTYSIEEYQDEIIKPVNFSLQRVYLETSAKIDPVPFEESILNNVNNFTLFNSQKNARLEAIKVKETSLKKSLARIDSLLLNISKQTAVGSSSNEISLRGEAKSNIESDLLKESRQITDELFDLEIQKEKQDKILVPFSKIRLVEPEKKYHLNLITGTIIGLLLSLLLLLSIEANRALVKYGRQKKYT